jgi:flagellar biosynthetic protein FliP
MKTFIQHYVEMVVAMFAGMFAWGQLKPILMPPMPGGAGAVEKMGKTAANMHEHGGAMASHGMAMGTDTSIWTSIGNISMMELSMIIPMVLWMKFRGHSWRHGAEMSAAMVVPSITIYAIGLAWPEVFGSTLSIWSHGAMLLGMLALMIVQRNMYMGHGRATHDQVPDARVTVAH